MRHSISAPPGQEYPPPYPHARTVPIDAGKLDELRELFSQEGPGEFERFMRSCRSSLERSMAVLRAAAASSDADGVGRCAHMIKGCSASLGADPLADACRRLEDAARHGRKKEEWDLASVEAEFARTLAALEPQAGRIES